MDTRDNTKRTSAEAVAVSSVESGDGETVDVLDADEEVEPTWQATALAALQAMSADAFERLCQRLLRQAGFINVVVTGRTGDGGIDGVGTYRMSLVSFPVFFQCKRYVGSVGAPQVRDFRGAMIGRGEKGLLITTGSFTSAARGEATRDGAPPLDLIDGEELVELLREHKLGITTELVEQVTVHPGFFDSI
jgi:restriction system protein